MRYVKLFFVSLLTVLSFTISLAQKELYPKNYFLFPIRPGERNYLAGNMGELRGNHFHSGIDIKTGGVIGSPVYAAADGYISRIKVSTSGYGYALYIKHPTGHSTVYAHLDSFNKEIADYTLQQQYKQESFEVELYPLPSQLPVKKGDIIAKSGNTGGSQGPHLHFEIRDKNEHILNPLYFDYKEIIDNTPPTFNKLLAKPLDITGRIEGKFNPKVYRIDRVKEGEYRIANPIKAWGTIGVAFDGIDRMDGVPNKNGITVYELKIDGKTIFKADKESFAFEHTRHINSHIDYHEYVYGRDRFEKCYVSDGNPLPFYQNKHKYGYINISDSTRYNAELLISDAMGNTSILNFVLEGVNRPTVNYINTIAEDTKIEFSHEIAENVLKLETSRIVSNSVATWKYKLNSKETKPAYQDIHGAVYLLDLRKGLPEHVTVNGQTYHFNFSQTVPPGGRFKLFQKDMTLDFATRTFADTVYLELYRKQDTLYIGNPSIPVFSNYEVTFTTLQYYPNPSKTHVYELGNRNHKSYIGGAWQTSNKFTFRTRSMGTFVLAEDTNPPTIAYLGRNRNTLRFRIKDDLSGIQSYRATVNGKWLMMEYDYKTASLWSKTLNPSDLLKGEFILEVTDRAGNRSQYQLKL